MILGDEDMLHRAVQSRSQRGAGIAASDGDHQVRVDVRDPESADAAFSAGSVGITSPMTDRHP
jgi:hypothetical protein